MRVGIHKVTRAISPIGSERYHLGEAAPLIIAEHGVIAGFLIQFQKYTRSSRRSTRVCGRGLRQITGIGFPGGSSKNPSSSIYTASAEIVWQMYTRGIADAAIEVGRDLDWRLWSYC